MIHLEERLEEEVRKRVAVEEECTLLRTENKVLKVRQEEVLKMLQQVQHENAQNQDQARQDMERSRLEFESEIATQHATELDKQAQESSSLFKSKLQDAAAAYDHGLDVRDKSTLSNEA